MYLFRTDRLATYFPRNPLLQEFITVVCTVKQYQPEPAFRIEYFADLFAKYTELTGKSVSSELQQIVAQEQSDFAEGTIKHLVNKVIYNEFTTRALEFHRAEFHEHTFDIHLTFKNSEVCIYNLDSVSDANLDAYDPVEANDTRFVKDTDKTYYQQILLQQGDGLIIAPQVTHFLGFYPENASEGQLITKAVVKIDQRYAALFGLY